MQATTSAYAASLSEPADGTAELLGWPDSAPLQPTCDLPVKALGLSKKVLHSNSFQALESTTNNVQVLFAVLFNRWPSASFKLLPSCLCSTSDSLATPQASLYKMPTQRPVVFTS